MIDFLIYSLKTIAIQLFFLVGFSVWLRKQTFFNLNRLYLLSAVILSLLIPVLTFSSFSTKFVQPESFILETLNLGFQSNLNTIENVKQNSFSILFWLYCIGFCICFVLFLLKLNTIRRYLKNSVIEILNEVKVYRIKNSNEAFSFLNFIFIGEKNQNTSIILQHELVHQRKVHSVDLLLLELLKIVFWFNPLLYVFQKYLTEVHEFEADNYAVKLNKKQYYETIISEVFQVNAIVFTNNFFNQSLIKKRIVMLQKSKSRKVELLKYTLAIPLVIVSILLFANCTSEKEKPETETLDSFINKMEGLQPNENKIVEPDENNIVPFAVVEKVCYFKSCEEQENLSKCFQTELDNYIKTNVTITDDLPKGTKMRVFVKFIIDEEGKIQDITIRSKENYPLLEKEIREVFENLPQIVPAENNGKKVKVSFTYPIMINYQ